MTARAYVHISCDWPGCYARIGTHFTKVAEARDWAARQGWKRLGGLVDVCGSPEQAETYSSDGPSWNGHAARTDHAPVVKPGSKGYVKLSCICGWTYVAPYRWQPPGECTRNMADHYWGKHVEEEEAKRTSGNPLERS